MEDTVGFGPVVINSRFTRKIQLINLGDIGANVNWDTKFCSAFFSISPSKVFIPPHEDIYFEVTFHPKAVDNDIKFKKVRC